MLVFTRDVRLKMGRTLRIWLVSEDDGDSTEVVFAVGDGEGQWWREDPAEGLSLPCAAVPRVRRALDILEAEYRSARARNG